MAMGPNPRPEQRRFNNMLMETKILKIEDIYVPVKRRKTLNPKVVNEIAESMSERGQLTSISVRRDGKRFVLVEGLQRLEACICRPPRRCPPASIPCPLSPGLPYPPKPVVPPCPGGTMDNRAGGRNTGLKVSG